MTTQAQSQQQATAQDPHYHERFRGVSRLYGPNGFAALQSAHVTVVGLGGVGSWTAEALARSGVARITLVDADDICVNNLNRQVHGTSSTVGALKAQALKQRLESIHPQCDVTALEEFFTDETAADILPSTPLPDSTLHVVADAIDSVKNKALLIASCLEAGLTVISSGGAGGRRRPDMLKLSRLNRTHDDPLLRNVRKQLRRVHGLANPAQSKVEVVYSNEPISLPWQNEGGNSQPAGRLDCATGFGTVAHVTASMGFFLAHLILESVMKQAEAQTTVRRE